MAKTSRPLQEDPSLSDPGRGTRRLACAVALALGAASAAAVFVLHRHQPGLPAGPCRVRALADELDRAGISGEKLRYGAPLPATQTRIMGETFLRSIVASPTQRIVFAEPLKAPRRFEFHAGLLHAFGEGETSPVTFRVLAARDGVERALYETTVDPAEGTDSWAFHSVDLAGEDVDGWRLVLVTEPGPVAGEGFPTRLPVWGAPLLVSGGASEAVNVVLVVLQGLRADRLGCCGGRPGVSPNIDGLAARGFLAECVIASSPSPKVSLRSLLTALAPGALAMNEPEKAQMVRYARLERLGAVMRRAGRPAAGFTGGGEAAAVFGLIADFDHLAELTPKTDTAAELVDRAVRFIRRHSTEPFFVLVHSAEVSSPWTDRRFAGTPPERLPDGFGFPGGPEARASFVPSAAEIEYARALYDGDLAAADRAVGRLVDALRGRGLLDRTVIAVTSTCGAELFERDWWGSGHGLTDEFLRVPLVMAGPGMEKRRISDPVRLERVAPALLEAAGIEAKLGGRPPAPLPAGGDGLVISGWSGGERWDWAVRRGRWRLLASLGRAEVRHLVDLRVDPAERRNLAESRPDTVRALEAELRAYAKWAARAAKLPPERAGTDDYGTSDAAAPDGGPEPGAGPAPPPGEPGDLIE